eukprot:5252585-Alexandrium_andersonii.AAC.1
MGDSMHLCVCAGVRTCAVRLRSLPARVWPDLLICSSARLLICASAHLLIRLSAHLLIGSSAHLFICACVTVITCSHRRSQRNRQWHG